MFHGAVEQVYWTKRQGLKSNGNKSESALSQKLRFISCSWWGNGMSEFRCVLLYKYDVDLIWQSFETIGYRKIDI